MDIDADISGLTEFPDLPRVSSAPYLSVTSSETSAAQEDRLERDDLVEATLPNSSFTYTSSSGSSGEAQETPLLLSITATQNEIGQLNHEITTSRLNEQATGSINIRHVSVGRSTTAKGNNGDS